MGTYRNSKFCYLLGNTGNRVNLEGDFSGELQFRVSDFEFWIFSGIDNMLVFCFR